MILGCDLAFDQAQAARVRSIVEEAAGGMCPCKVGKACPVLGRPRFDLDTGEPADQVLIPLRARS